MQLGGVHVHGNDKHDGTVSGNRNKLASRALATVYQNLEGREIIVTAAIVADGVGDTTLYCYHDTFSPPTTVRHRYAGMGVNEVLCKMVVPASSYYKIVCLSATPALTLWVEEN